jgi:hypothetical protein
MTVGVSTLTLWGVRRQDELRRAAAGDPQALSDPAGFLLDVAAHVVAETFLFAVAALLLALALGALLRRRVVETRNP